ncbi:MAG: NADH-quinone oxidoreductase subunit 5 family protein [Chloroflexota bacterium]
MEPIAQLVAVLTLLPLLAGLICYFIRSSAIRSLTVIVTTIVLIAASLLLLQNGPFEYTPPPIAGIDWNVLITIADMALLVVFLALGLHLRNALITLLALAQAAIMGYFEFVMGAHVEVKPALYVDELSIIMALVISIVGSLIGVYALQYMRDHEHHIHLAGTRQPRFFFWLVMFLGAMNALVFANNLLWVYFFWEITTLCSFMLIRHDLTQESIANATRALWMNSLGGVAFAGAIVLLYERAHTLSLRELISAGAQPEAVLLPLSLLVFAGFTKSAQMPFQSWLLGAMVAPTPVSALLHSSTMVKAGVYLVVRLAPAYVDTNLSLLVALAGSFTFLLAAVLAISQSNAKRVLAYSTISNLGLIIACAGLNTPLAISAAILLIVFHAISKALLFLCTGTIEHKIGSRDIEDMEGLISRQPLLATITVVGILTMVLPPFAVLISKWAAIEASVKMPLITLFFVVGSAATVVFWVKWVGKLLGAPSGVERRGGPALETLYSTPLLLLVVMAVALSAVVAPVVNLVVEHAVMPYYKVAGISAAGADLSTGVGFITVWPLFLVLLLVVVPAYLFVRVKAEQVRPAYMCGEHTVAGPAVEFRSLQDKSEAVVTTGYYFEKALGETSLNRWANPVAIALLVALVGVVLR